MKKWYFDSMDTTLDNGLRVLTIKRDTQIASLQIGIKAGPLYEDIEEKGISHFIEHMLFKGTLSRNNEELNNELECLGGEYNAYTDYSCTVYSITALEEEMEKSVDILSDMLINSTLPKEELEKERGVILAEIRTSKDDLEDFSFKRLNEVAFHKSPLRYDIIGNEENVKKFSRKILIDYYKKNYVPNNAVIVLVSSYDHEEALDLIKTYFNNWQYCEVKIKDIIKENNKSTKAISYKKDIEQSTITYLYTFHDLDKNKELPLKILNHKLGESANSVLFREVRENRGLAYDIYTHMDMTNNIKTLTIYTAVAEETIEEAIEAIEECIVNIKNKTIVFNKETVELMKKVHKTAVVSTLEDSTDLCNYVLHQCMENEDIYEFINDMKELQGIDSEDIYEVANRVLNNPTIHILKSEN
ncbi:M16 family metallopeptidase [Desnuesiella massiliensis]|uniref:M16 family metallopeptidase n=1 Tax=Desnuesiella massiliensis TaxID=1650662 RepID=UPI0006E3D195|nr:pitrilysin family protein [Desnuesiella massiliensis]